MSSLPAVDLKTADVSDLLTRLRLPRRVADAIARETPIAPDRDVRTAPPRAQGPS